MGVMRNKKLIANGVAGLISIACLAATPALAQSTSADSASSSSAPHIDYAAIKARYAHAKWTYPTSEEIADAYPREAQDSRIQGAAQVACFIQPDGHMKRCVVLAESPKDEGFGTATSQLFLKYANVDPATVNDGVQSGDFYIFTLNWRMGPG